MNTPYYIARRYLVSKSSNNAINFMSFLAAFGVFVSAASLFVVLSGFSGLKDFSLGFISYTSPDLNVLGLHILANVRTVSSMYEDVRW